MRPEDMHIGLVVTTAMAMAGVDEDVMTAEAFVATRDGRIWCQRARHALAAVIPLVQAAEREAIENIPVDVPLEAGKGVDWTDGATAALIAFRDAIRARNTPQRKSASELIGRPTLAEQLTPAPPEEPAQEPEGHAKIITRRAGGQAMTDRCEPPPELRDRDGWH